MANKPTRKPSAVAKNPNHRQVFAAAPCQSWAARKKKRKSVANLKTASRVAQRFSDRPPARWTIPHERKRPASEWSGDQAILSAPWRTLPTAHRKTPAATTTPTEAHAQVWTAPKAHGEAKSAAARTARDAATHPPATSARCSGATSEAGAAAAFGGHATSRLLGGAVAPLEWRDDFEGDRINPKTTCDFGGKTTTARPPDRDSQKFRPRPCRKLNAHAVPGRRPDRRLGRDVEAVGTVQVEHVQARPAVRSNVFSPNVTRELVSPTVSHRHDLVDGLVVFVPRHGKLHSEASGAVVGARIREIDGEEPFCLDVPIEAGVERRAFEVSVEEEIGRVAAARPIDDSHPLEVSPDVGGVPEPSQLEQAGEVGLDPGQPEGRCSGRGRLPHLAGKIRFPARAQKIDEGQCQFRIFFSSGQDPFHDRLRVANRAQRGRKNRAGIGRTYFEHAPEMRHAFLVPIIQQVVIARHPVEPRSHRAETQGALKCRVSARGIPDRIARRAESRPVTGDVRSEFRGATKFPHPFDRVEVLEGVRVNQAEPVVQLRA